jgi:hypothetical protein
MPAVVFSIVAFFVAQTRIEAAFLALVEDFKKQFQHLSLICPRYAEGDHAKKRIHPGGSFSAGGFRLEVHRYL